MYFPYQQQTILNHYIPQQNVSFILRLRNMGKKSPVLSLCKDARDGRRQVDGSEQTKWSGSWG